MKKHLNTLFVTTQGAYLAKEREAVLVRVDSETKLRLPIHTLGGIVCFGNVGCSPYLMAHCAENNVGLSFLSEYGRFLARVQGAVSGNVLLRRQQYRVADDMEASAGIAYFFLTGKLANCRTVLRRSMRDHGDKIDTEAIDNACLHVAHALNNIRPDMPLDTLRGIEGDAAKNYFNVFDHLITSQKTDFSFTGRNRRPPLDEVNCLLSFVYTLLLHDVRSALEAVGLDPQVGFLHRDRPGRPSLALDIMEEFRPFFADRLVLSLINLGKIQKKGFQKSQTGAVVMKENIRKDLLVAYQKRKQDEVTHPFLGEKVTIGILFHLQALLFARYLRNDIDGYPPFIWR
jgi:CRISP-associated protein Cas1